MKSIIATIIMAIMLCSTAMAVGEHADDATYDPDMDVHEMSWWERLTDKLEIGTYDSSGSFTTNFYQGDVVTAKFDETTWNVQCSSSKFVIEVYSPSGFKGAKYYWTGPASGNEHFAGSLKHTLSDETGTWAFVDYILCVDSTSSSYNKVISNANKITFSVLSQSSSETCSPGYIGVKVCSDGDVKRTYRSSDCSTELRTVESCAGDSFCFDGSCEDPECSSDSDCDPWQECKSRECVTTDESVKRYEDSQDDGSGSSGSGDSGDTGGSQGGDIGGGTGDGDSDDRVDPDTEWVMWVGFGVAAIGAVVLALGVVPVGIGMVAVGAIMMLLKIFGVV